MHVLKLARGERHANSDNRHDVKTSENTWDDEIAALYGRPRFTDDEQLEYFALAATEKALVLEPFYSTKSHLSCMLQHGYFKVCHRFCIFDQPLATQRIVLPAYSVMQDTVGTALTAEQNRLSTLPRRYLGPSETHALAVLLRMHQGCMQCHAASVPQGL